MNALFEFYAGTKSVQLFGDRREASVDGRSYSDLSKLVKDNPDLTNWPESLARIANFLARTLEFRVLLEPAREKRAYKERIESETTSPRKFLQRSSDFGIYDIATITEPHMEDDKLIFYAEQQSTGVPHRVECLLKSSTVHYTPLELRTTKGTDGAAK